MKILKKIIIPACVLLIMFSLIQAEEGKWVEKNPLPKGLRNHRAVYLDGKIYAVGGYCPDTEDKWEVLNFEYDLKTDQWKRQADMPTGRSNLGLVVLDHKIYAIGGDVFSNKNECYDPKTNQWRELSPLPYSIQHLNAATYKKKIYVIGGLIYTGNQQKSGYKDINEKTFASPHNLIYNPVKNQWQQGTPLPSPRHGSSLAVVKDQIYVFGGAGNATSLFDMNLRVDVYTPATNSWVRKKDMPFFLLGADAVVANDLVYIIGGQTRDENNKMAVKDTILQYNPVNEEWKRVMKLPKPIQFAGITLVNDEVFIIGGCGSDFKEYTSLLTTKISR